MQKQLEMFESIFGTKMWDHVITEISFWRYTDGSIKEREKNQQSEDQKHKDWNEVYRRKFAAANVVPTIFIDPLFNLSNSTKRGREEFTKWTTEFWNFANSMKPYSCKELCSAPDSTLDLGPRSREPQGSPVEIP